MPRTKGFGNRTAARSKSACARRKARTSSCEALKLAKAFASGGAARGSTIRGAFILKAALTMARRDRFQDRSSPFAMPS